MLCYVGTPNPSFGGFANPTMEPDFDPRIEAFILRSPRHRCRIDPAENQVDATLAVDAVPR